eukprot:scaffold7484_cov334-Pinguiococcus_pyrenoidosus.AAC.1
MSWSELHRHILHDGRNIRLNVRAEARGGVGDTPGDKHVDHRAQQQRHPSQGQQEHSPPLKQPQNLELRVVSAPPLHLPPELERLRVPRGPGASPRALARVRRLRRIRLWELSLELRWLSLQSGQRRRARRHHVHFGVLAVGQLFDRERERLLLREFLPGRVPI